MRYPALDVRAADPEIVLAVVDDFSPTAVEEIAGGISIYFTSGERRDDACAAIERTLPGASVAPREVDDEDWARRSQQNLTPVTVGRIIVAPPWFADVPFERDASPVGAAPSAVGAASSARHSSTSDPVRITILPSMGFGTGHHATTRLCLGALQTLDLKGRTALDVGTGSGVLAIAAARLGAADAAGIDVDPDAVASARENLALNPEAGPVRFEVTDMRAAPLPAADVVMANLTGAVLVQNARLLLAAVRPGGTLLVSGIQSHERDEVLVAFGEAPLSWSDNEDGWVALAFRPAS